MAPSRPAKAVYNIREMLWIVAALGACSAATTVSGQTVKGPRDPNEKVCQVIKPVGSRLATRKVCATRAEWEAQKQQDRELTERAQTQLCVVNPMTGKCGN